MESFVNVNILHQGTVNAILSDHLYSEQYQSWMRNPMFLFAKNWLFSILGTLKTDFCCRDNGGNCENLTLFKKEIQGHLKFSL